MGGGEGESEGAARELGIRERLQGLGKLTSCLLQTTKHPTQQAEDLHPAFPDAWPKYG